jgi:modulator of FtsH protease
VTAYDASQWTDLFVASAGASAALAGLVFVAVSINVDRILKLPGVPERALQTVLLLLLVVVVSIVGLVPGQDAVALGAELVGLGLLFAVPIGVMTGRSLKGGPRARSWVVYRLLVSAAGTVPFVVAGASLMAETGGGLYWSVGGMVVAIAGGVANAWALLIEILR